MKLKKNIIDHNAQALKPSTEPSPEERRQAKIDYYRNWFRLDFRVYDEDEIEAEGGIDEASYYERGSSFDFNDEDVIYYQKKFESENALDVFYDLCLDYCQDSLKVLRKNMKKYSVLTELKIKEYAEGKNHKGQHPNEKQQARHMRKLLNEQMRKEENNLCSQKKLKAQIALIKKKIVELGKTDVKPKLNVLTVEPKQVCDEKVVKANAQTESNAKKITMITAVAITPELNR